MKILLGIVVFIWNMSVLMFTRNIIYSQKINKRRKPMTPEEQCHIRNRYIVSMFLFIMGGIATSYLSEMIY